MRLRRGLLLEKLERPNSDIDCLHPHGFLLGVGGGGSIVFVGYEALWLS